MRYHDPVLDLVPKTGWLSKYYAYTSKTEFNPRFVIFSCFSFVGSLLNNRVGWTRVEGLFAPIYANPWVILIGPAGHGHKTSVLNLCYYFIQALPEALRPKVLSEQITPEALVKALTVPRVVDKKLAAHLKPPDAVGLILAPELAVFLGKQHYNAGMVTLLTRLYDCPPEGSADTLTRGLAPLHNVCLSILGGVVPRWLSTMIPDEAFTGGPMSRFNLVIMPKQWDEKVWQPPVPPSGLQQEIAAGLETFTELSGAVTFTPEAEQWITDWYEHTPAPRDQDDLMDAYFARKPEHIIRIATLLEIFEHGTAPQLGIKSLTTGLQLMDLLETELTPFLETRITTARTESIQKVLEILGRPKYQGRLSRRALLNLGFRYLPGKTPEFNEIINLLKQAGKIRQFTPGKDKQDVWYELTEQHIVGVRRPK